ncbi:hypothetical protein ACFFX0_14550 [Citricoccus parietis]|uniref:Uncharacterized protein n=1 Tax=Citricoccus parietis TaxID=592307 RepID=A0ABV5G0A2_9MICC
MPMSDSFFSMVFLPLERSPNRMAAVWKPRGSTSGGVRTRTFDHGREWNY